ncbi:hypothetical protein GOV14_02240 [Candidatus Pacearchaeota archaeon]|nr:hypothetical protein [Candidatus Pacearchaeota archaeon]
MEMRYDLATNFDDELLKKVGEFGVVKSVYGKLASDIVGGGRPTFNLPKISKKELEGHVSTAHDNNIKFSYLFNALCSDNREFVSKSNKEIRSFVKYLGGIGVDVITVASPFMLRLVKETSPEIDVSISIYDDLDSFDRIRSWQDLGADELTLHYSFNRNFPKLKTALQMTDMNLRIIANNTCLHECIYRSNHANALAHSSQSKHESGGFFLDFYSLNCGKEKLQSPGKLIAADWIRPEDVHYYEELCDSIGKTNLSLKLTDRSRPTDWLVGVVKAYAEKSYDGNLFDILNYRNKEFSRIDKTPFIKGALLGKARVDKMRAMQDAVFPPRAYIDNKSLNGFMKPFINGHDCSSKVCDISGFHDDQKLDLENACRYCRNIAENHLSFEGGEDARREYLGKANNSVKDMTNGEMFEK